MFNLIFIGIHIISLFLILILISFDPSDPGWMQSMWHGAIHNKGGKIGAQISDFLFFCFGMAAYTIPIMILICIWFFFIKKININLFRIYLMLMIVSIFLIISCVLSQLIIDDIVYFSSGGVIGNIFYDIIKSEYDIRLYVIYCFSIIVIAFWFCNFFLRKIIQKKIIFLYI